MSRVRYPWGNGESVPGSFDFSYEPIDPGAGEEFDFLPIVAVGDDGTEGDEDNVDEAMIAAATAAWVVEFGKVAADRQSYTFGP